MKKLGNWGFKYMGVQDGALKLWKPVGLGWDNQSKPTFIQS